MSATTYWEVLLVICLVAALAAAGLLALLVRTVRKIDSSVDGLLAAAGQVAENTAHIPNLQATGPVVGLIVEELHVQDDYMNALTDGFGSVTDVAGGN
jgi:hypothetical protein